VRKSPDPKRVEWFMDTLANVSGKPRETFRSFAYQTLAGTLTPHHVKTAMRGYVRSSLEPHASDATSKICSYLVTTCRMWAREHTPIEVRQAQAVCFVSIFSRQMPDKTVTAVMNRLKDIIEGRVRYLVRDMSIDEMLYMVESAANYTGEAVR